LWGTAARPGIGGTESPRARPVTNHREDDDDRESNAAIVLCRYRRDADPRVRGAGGQGGRTGGTETLRRVRVRQGLAAVLPARNRQVPTMRARGRFTGVLQDSEGHDGGRCPLHEVRADQGIGRMLQARCGDVPQVRIGEGLPGVLPDNQGRRIHAEMTWGSLCPG
jgi:hypothetical protein